MKKKPTVLMILDGYGMRDTCEHNAVCEAKTPIMDQLMSQCPFVKGEASGLAVGLPDGQMGNSEVGHMNMGTGSSADPSPESLPHIRHLPHSLDSGHIRPESSIQLVSYP